MNSGFSEHEKGQSQGAIQEVWQALAILAAAMLLGLAYNHHSPLGVRPRQSPDTKTEPAAAGTNTQASPPLTLSNAATNAAQPAELFAALPAFESAPATASPAPVTPSGELRFPELKWPEVKALLAANQIVLVDARLAETFALTHIPGAVSLPAYSPPEQLQAFARSHPQHQRYVLYCNSDTCDMSHELATKLARQYGYTNLTLMPGGFAEYVIAEPAAAAAAPPP